MITDPVTCNSFAYAARHSGTSALITFALLNGRRGARTNWHPACTDSISLTRSLSGNAVIIPVTGLKIGVCARQKSSKIRKSPRNVDRRGRDLLQAFPSEQRIKRFEARVPGTRYSWDPLPIWRICKAQKGRRAAASGA